MFEGVRVRIGYYIKVPRGGSPHVTESGIEMIEIQNPEGWNPESNASLDSVTWGDEVFSPLFEAKDNQTFVLWASRITPPIAVCKP